MSLKMSSRLKELRFHFCQTSPASEGIREFIKSHYVELKKANPNFPFLIRECSGVQPRLWARYEKGVEQSFALTNLKNEDILNRVKIISQ